MNADWIPAERLQTRILKDNLRYLRASEPDWLQSLQANRDDEHIFVQKQGNIVLCRNGDNPPRWIFGEHSPHEGLATIKERIQKLSGNNRLIVLYGCANGYALSFLLPMLEAFAELLVLWLEPSNARVLSALSFVDIRAAMNTGRFYVSVSSPNVDDVLDKIEQHNLTGLEPVFVAMDDGLDIDELHRRYEDVSQRHAEETQRTIESIEGVGSKSGDILRKVMLIDCWPNAVQHQHVQSIVLAMQDADVETETFTLEGFRFEFWGREYQRRYLPALLDRLTEFQPGLILSYAYHAPHIVPQEWFERLEIPWLQVISNLVFFDENYWPNETTAVCDENLVSIYRKRGAQNVITVPIMGNTTVAKPIETDRSIPIVFVGNSLGLKREEVDAYFHKWQGRDVLIQYVSDALAELGDFDRQENIYRFMAEHPVPQIDSLQEDFDVYRFLLCQATEIRRATLLESVAHLGLHVYGNWQDKVSERSPLRACLQGYLSMEREAELYARGNLFLNIHSVGHVTSPNMRFFNVSGHSGLQISDGMFGNYLEPDRETLFYTSKAELVEKVQYALAHPERMDEVRSNGLQRVRSDWTYRNWLIAVCESMGYQLP